jgi:hypothetical protein
LETIALRQSSVLRRSFANRSLPQFVPQAPTSGTPTAIGTSTSGSGAVNFIGHGVQEISAVMADLVARFEFVHELPRINRAQPSQKQPKTRLGILTKKRGCPS